MKNARSVFFGLGLLAAGGYGGGRWYTAARWRAEISGPASAPVPDHLWTAPLQAARSAAMQWPVQREAVERLAALYLANGFNAEAAKLLPGIRARRPDAPEWAHRHAVLLADEGRLQEAVALWQEIREASRAYLPVRVKLADALGKLNREAEAEAVYRELLADRPGYSYAWYGLIMQDVRHQLWAAARDKLRQAIPAAPDFYGHYALLETVARHQGDEPEAALADRHLKRLGRFRPVPDPWCEPAVADCFDPYRLRVDADRLRGDAEQAGGGVELAGAMARLERAIALEPANALNFQLLATLHGIGGDQAGAERAYEKALELDPRSETLYLRYANLLARQGNQAALRSLLERATVQCPGDADIALRLAENLAQAGRWQEAGRHYQQALSLRPDRPELACQAALAFFRAGQEADGMAILQENLRRFPRHEETLGYLVMNAVRKGETRSAQELLARLATVAPEAPATGRLRQMVQDRFGPFPAKD